MSLALKGLLIHGGFLILIFWEEKSNFKSNSLTCQHHSQSMSCLNWKQEKLSVTVLYLSPWMSGLLLSRMGTSRSVTSWTIRDVPAQHRTRTARRAAGDMWETGEGWTLITWRPEQTWRKSGLWVMLCLHKKKSFHLSHSYCSGTPTRRRTITLLTSHCSSSRNFSSMLIDLICRSCPCRVDGLVQKPLSIWPCPWLAERELSTCAGKRSVSRSMRRD